MRCFSRPQLTSCRDVLLAGKHRLQLLLQLRNFSQGMDHIERTADNTRQQEMSRATVVKMSDLSPSVKGLTLKVHNPDVSFKAGQWLDMFIPGIQTIGGFSMSSSPHLLKRHRQIELAIKHSRHPPAYWVHSQCQVGSEVEVRVGGDFFFDPSSTSTRGRCVLLIAGGVGINPMVSILRHISDLQEQKQRHQLQQNQHQQNQPPQQSIAANDPECPPKACLLYSARTNDELIFRGDLDDIGKKFSNIRTRYFITREPSTSGPGVCQRRIKQEDVEEAVRWLDCKVEQVDVYICGPGPMIDGICLTLTQAGLPLSSIHFERWW